MGQYLANFGLGALTVACGLQTQCAVNIVWEIANGQHGHGYTLVEIRKCMHFKKKNAFRKIDFLSANS